MHAIRTTILCLAALALAGAPPACAFPLKFIITIDRLQKRNAVLSGDILSFMSAPNTGAKLITSSLDGGGATSNWTCTATFAYLSLRTDPTPILNIDLVA